MPRMVGFTRIIKLPWLNKTLELAGEGLDAAQMRSELEDYLSFEIKSDTNRRKTREILLLPWTVDDDALATLRLQALELAKSHPYEQLPIHWGMLIAAFPMFADLVRLIGKMSEYQDELTSAQIKQKVLDEWGERSTVVKGSEKMLASLNAIGVVKRVKTGRYVLAPATAVDEDLSAFLLQADMLVNPSSYRTYGELLRLPEMFPFEMNVSKERLNEDNRFAVGNFGREFTVSLQQR
jgi:hypothetical protein